MKRWEVRLAPNSPNLFGVVYEDVSSQRWFTRTPSPPKAHNVWFNSTFLGLNQWWSCFSACSSDIMLEKHNTGQPVFSTSNCFLETCMRLGWALLRQVPFLVAFWNVGSSWNMVIISELEGKICPWKIAPEKRMNGVFLKHFSLRSCSSFRICHIFATEDTLKMR